MYLDYNLGETRKLTSKIDAVLSSSGLLFRVFGRAKNLDSLSKKIEDSPGKYTKDGKKIQDFFGVRVALYFADDIDIAIELIKDEFEIVWGESVIDSPEGYVFSARRCNLVVKLPSDIEINYPVKYKNLIDQTCEIQIRTILSEGWHEVEHDLRYKAKDEWEGHQDLGRALNGIYATLETSDWSMIKLFEELSHRHYRDGKVLEMLRTKFRIRLQSEVSNDILSILDADKELLKSLFRAPRKEVVKALTSVCKFIPLSPDVLIHVINRGFVQDSRVKLLESDSIEVFLDNTFNRD